jgi:pyrophosphatase PpaX
MSRNFRCIVFDMDGTLTDTNTLIFHSFNHVAEKYTGRRLSAEEIISFFGPPEEGAVEKMLGPERLQEAMPLYYAFYAGNHQQYASLHEGMREILDLLKKKDVSIGLFTGKGRRTTEISLEQFSIKDYFDVIMSGDDVAEYKPSGDGLRRIMAALDVAPGQCLMVGDAVADIVAARDAGVPVASVLWDSYGRDHVLKMDPDYVFHSVGEFSDWIAHNI